MNGSKVKKLAYSILCSFNNMVYCSRLGHRNAIPTEVEAELLRAVGLPVKRFPCSRCGAE